MTKVPAVVLFVSAAVLLGLATIREWDDYGETWEGVLTVFGIFCIGLAVLAAAVGVWALRQR